MRPAAEGKVLLWSWGSSLKQIAGGMGGVGHNVAWALQNKNTAQKVFQACDKTAGSTCLTCAASHVDADTFTSAAELFWLLAACVQLFTVQQPWQQRVLVGVHNTTTTMLREFRCSKSKAPWHLNDCLHACLCICWFTRSKRGKKGCSLDETHFI